MTIFRRMPALVTGVAVAGLALCGCAASGTDAGKEYPGNGGTTGQVGNILLTDQPNQAGGDKVIVTSYKVTAASVDPQEAMVSFGSRGSTSGGGDDYTLELVAVDGDTLARYTVWSPRKAIVEKEGVVENPEGILTARFQFRPEAASVRVRDDQGRVVAETDVRNVIREFCRRLQNDRDCAMVTESK